MMTMSLIRSNLAKIRKCSILAGFSSDTLRQCNAPSAQSDDELSNACHRVTHRLTNLSVGPVQAHQMNDRFVTLLAVVGPALALELSRPLTVAGQAQLRSIGPMPIRAAHRLAAAWTWLSIESSSTLIRAPLQWLAVLT